MLYASLSTPVEDLCFHAQGTDKDIFLGYGNIVGFLIAVHVVAFLFWLFLLARGGNRPLRKVATD